MRIFYSYSNHNNSSLEYYEKIITYLNDKYKQDIIIDVDIFNGKYELLEKITSHIDSCELFICDITPDNPILQNITNNTTLFDINPNPNVMVELGYAISKKKEIIIIKDKSFDTDKIKMCNLPSLIIGKYNIYDLDNEYDNILNIIDTKIKIKCDKNTIFGTILQSFGNKLLENKNEDLHNTIKSISDYLINIDK